MKRLACLLAVSRSGFHRWPAGEPGRVAAAAADDELADRIRTIHAASGGACGAPRITIELRDQGRPVNHKRVERVMHQHRIAGQHLRRRIRTTARISLASQDARSLGAFTAARKRIG